MDAALNTVPDAPFTPAQKRLLLVLTLWFAMALIDVGIVNVALPSIQADIHASPSDLQWVLSGYTLSFGAILIAAGRAGDVIGRGGLFLLGLLVFTLASLAASLAPDPRFLNIARLIEGIGAGCMSPQVYGMVQAQFSGAARGRAFGFLGMATSLAVAIAPALGGALIALGGPHWGWRFGFLVNVPLGLAGIMLTWRWLPKPLWRKVPGKALIYALDPFGCVLAAAAMLAILLPFVTATTTPGMWLCLPAGLIISAGWISWERFYKHLGYTPMVDLAVFRIRHFSYGLSIQWLYFLGMTAVWVLIMLYVQQSAGMSALAAGMLALPPAVAAAAAARWAGNRIHTQGRKLVIYGQYTTLFGLLLSALIIAAHNVLSPWWLLLALSVYGVGQGMTISPNQTLTLDEAPLAHAGTCGALVSTTQRLGASIGIAMVTAITFATLEHASWPTAALAGLCLIMLLVALSTLIGQRDLRRA